MQISRILAAKIFRPFQQSPDFKRFEQRPQSHRRAADRVVMDVYARLAQGLPADPVDDDVRLQFAKFADEAGRLQIAADFADRDEYAPWHRRFSILPPWKTA